MWDQIYIPVVISPNKPILQYLLVHIDHDFDNICNDPEFHLKKLVEKILFKFSDLYKYLKFF